MSSIDTINPLPRTLFSTKDIDIKSRLSVWHESISVMFDFTLGKDVDKGQFFAELESYLINDIMIVKCSSNEARFHRTKRMVAQDCMDYFMIQLFVKGFTDVRVYGKDSNFLEEGGFTLFDLSRPIDIYNANYSNISIIIPRYHIENILPHAEDLHGIPLSLDKPGVRLLRSHLIALVDNLDTMDVSTGNDVHSPTISMALNALRSEYNSLEHPEDAGVDQITLAEVKRYVRKNIRNPQLCPDLISMEIGISRSKLYRLTEEMGGLSNFIRKERLRACLNDLTNPRNSYLSIQEISYQWGFDSVRTFGRVFKQQYGMTPKEARAETAKLLSRRKSAIENGSFVEEAADRTYEQWLANL